MQSEFLVKEVTLQQFSELINELTAQMISYLADITIVTKYHQSCSR